MEQGMDRLAPGEGRISGIDRHHILCPFLGFIHRFRPSWYCNIADTVLSWCIAAIGLTLGQGDKYLLTPRRPPTAKNSLWDVVDEPVPALLHHHTGVQIGMYVSSASIWPLVLLQTDITHPHAWFLKAIHAMCAVFYNCYVHCICFISFCRKCGTIFDDNYFSQIMRTIQSLE